MGCVLPAGLWKIHGIVTPAGRVRNANFGIPRGMMRGKPAGSLRNDTSVFKLEMVLLLDGWGAVGCEVFAGRNLAPSSRLRAARRFFSFSGERKERGRKGRCSGAKEDFGASRPSPPWCAYRGISPRRGGFLRCGGEGWRRIHANFTNGALLSNVKVLV